MYRCTLYENDRLTKFGTKLLLVFFWFGSIQMVRANKHGFYGLIDCLNVGGNEIDEKKNLNIR